MQTTMSSGQKYVLYYAPGLCSMAPHIALEATGLPYELERVTMKDGKYTLEDGTDLTEVNPKKKVPALKCPNGKILTEGPVISQYIADQVRSEKLLYVQFEQRPALGLLPSHYLAMNVLIAGS
eukprot:gb/GECG01005001.1/.p1 GENE.gb/GECG01005001.1/~~gb/GECG01005001.1/.p1  ORF type:complete len:123 (+),score=7.56 gb/GECG01005001.1/:1-369(+)